MMPSMKAIISKRLHPEFLDFARALNVPIELLGIHTPELNFQINTVSENSRDRESMTPDPEKMLACQKDMRGRQRNVASGRWVGAQAFHSGMESHIPYERMNDEQLAQSIS